jgi:ketosteroid isomerase-like protein
MAAEENVATIERIYAAFGAGDVDTILDACAGDVDWAVDAAGDDAPWWGRRHGTDEVVGFFTGIAATTDVTGFEIVALASTSNEVLSFIRYAFAAKGGGPATHMNLHHYFRFDANGKIDFVRAAEDTQAVAEVLAGQPARATSAATS